MSGLHGVWFFGWALPIYDADISGDKALVGRIFAPEQHWAEDREKIVVDPLHEKSGMHTVEANKFEECDFADAECQGVHDKDGGWVKSDIIRDCRHVWWWWAEKSLCTTIYDADSSDYEEGGTDDGPCGHEKRLSLYVWRIMRILKMCVDVGSMSLIRLRSWCEAWCDRGGYELCEKRKGHIVGNRNCAYFRKLC